MLGQTGRDLENKDKRKIRQEDKPGLNNDGTQTEERKEDKNGHRRVGVRRGLKTWGREAKPGPAEGDLPPHTGTALSNGLS